MKYGKGIFPLGIVLGMLAAGMCHASAQGTSVPSIVSTCEGCHGPGGNSTTTTVPRLNGQQADYLAARFRSFRDLTSQTPHATDNMWPMTSKVPDREIPAVASYFASQAPTQLRPSGPLAAQGKAIYQHGAQDIPACQSCHGENAEGKGLVPRLAGQHVDYLKAQLSALNLQLRVSKMMHPNVKNMSQDQIDALVAFLSNG